MPLQKERDTLVNAVGWFFRIWKWQWLSALWMICFIIQDEKTKTCPRKQGDCKYLPVFWINFTYNPENVLLEHVLDVKVLEFACPLSASPKTGPAHSSVQ